MNFSTDKVHVWKIFTYFQRELKNLLNQLKSQIVPDFDVGDYILRKILPFLHRFFNRYINQFSFPNLFSESDKICKEIYDIVYNLFNFLQSNSTIFDAKKKQYLCDLRRVVDVMENRQFLVCFDSFCFLLFLFSYFFRELHPQSQLENILCLCLWIPRHLEKLERTLQWPLNYREMKKSLLAFVVL